MKQAFVFSTDQGGGKRRAISQARSTVRPVERSHAHWDSGFFSCSGGPRSASRSLDGKVTQGVDATG